MGKTPTERLMEALNEAQAPQEMRDRARSGRYDRSVVGLERFPISTLVEDARQHGLIDIALRALDGEFDAVKV